MTLTPDHYKMLHIDSAIADAVMTHRGYLSLDDPAAVKALGFAPYQAKCVPTLAIPLWNVHGEQRGWQLRHNPPRQKKNGDLVKYDTPTGARLTLDVHPSVQPLLGDPHVPLWITEGVKKGDALASQGACAIALMGGVHGYRGTNAHGGKVILPDWDHVALNGRMVIVAYDSDLATNANVEHALQRLWAMLRHRDALPSRVEWSEDYQQKKWGVDDYLATGKTLDDLFAMVPFIPFGSTPAKPPAKPPAPLEHPDRPSIDLDINQTRIINEGQQALMALPNGPIVYQRARGLAVIARGVKPPKWLHRPEDMPVMIEAGKHHLSELLGQAANWMKDFGKGIKAAVLPPPWVVLMLQARPSWPFPVLEGIVTAPTLRPDGSLLMTPGYDPETGLYLDYNGTDFPSGPLAPTIDDARSAIGALQEAVQDFPWTAPHHFSATLAAILSLVCRYAIDGNVPLFAIRANTRGSGKSLLADVISIIGTGRAAPRWPQVQEDDEERKRLLTVGLAGYPCIHIDNVTRPLGSPALDLALTSPTYTDRILGKNESREAPLNMVWLASGNNMQFKGDTARRVVPIDLDPKMEKPEERTDFQYDPLETWVRQERPRLTVAALTILRAYFEADRPSQNLTPMGSFEAWSDLVRQALVWAGETDPNLGRTDIEAESDPEYEQHAVLLETWWQCYGTIAQTLAEVQARMQGEDILRRAAVPPRPANEWNALHAALGAYDRKYDGTHFDVRTVGRALRNLEGRLIAKKRFVKAGKSHQAQLWKIEELTKGS